MRTAIAELSKEALIHNVKFIKNKVGSAKIMAMLKADAYGHDSVQISKVLQEHAQDLISSIGVARIKEAIKLKQANVKIPIVLMQGFLSKDELDLAVQNNFEVVIYNQHQLDLLNNLKNNTFCKIWLKFDTGMNRLGFRVFAKNDINLNDLSSIKDNVNQLIKDKKIKQEVGIMSHFSCASNPKDLNNIKQMQLFEKLANFWQGPKSIANSAAILSIKNSQYDLVRPGIMLLGISPFDNQTGSSLGLKPVMNFKAFVLDIKTLNKNDCIGYGAKYTCPEDTKVAVISVGYGDGYPWTDTVQNYVFYKNQKLKVLGAISMDMIVVDCSNVKDISIGDMVELWGNNIPVESFACNFNTIPYELITKITSRVDRVLV